MKWRCSNRCIDNKKLAQANKNDRHHRFEHAYFLALFTNSSCGIFPTISGNFDIGVFPNAALGLHYAYEREDLHLQASLYNGVGHHHFTGSDNVFRFRPKTDGIFAMGQAEYRYRGSHYFVGASVHTRPSVQPTVWAYAEQALLPHLTLLAAAASSGDISWILGKSVIASPPFW